MTTDDELKKEDYLHRELPFETAEVDGTAYVRELDGTWRYAHSWIKVPGARDLTLTERFQPKLIVASTATGEAQVERVVVSGESIAAHPDLLDWCLAEGAKVQGPGPGVFEVLVPVETWNEHDRIPGEIVAPEHSENQSERELAQAEREYREADRALEIAAAHRAEVLRQYAEDMTRQEARAITDLSVGRIQQLIREDVGDLDEIDRSLLVLVSERRPKNIKTLHKLLNTESGIVHPSVLIKQRVLSLGDRALIDLSDSNGLQITPEGKIALRMSGRPEQPSIEGVESR